MSVLIRSPWVVVNKETLSIIFFRFDLKAVKDVVDATGATYKAHFSAKTSVNFTFHSPQEFNAATIALMLHYQPLNQRA